MHFSEDDLKNALQRKDPGPGFTQRVMAGVSQGEEAKAATQAESRKRFAWRGWTWRLRPVLIGAVAAIALIIGGGLGYRQYERVQREHQQAALAQQEMMRALRITSAKLNHVLKRVNEPQVEEPKIRRQSL